jgi:hypothetical protein
MARSSWLSGVLWRLVLLAFARVPPGACAQVAVGNRRLGVIGARYDVASTTALKAEYHRARSGSGAWANEVAVQVAVGF